MGSSLCEALLPSQALRRQNPGVMGIWQLRSHGAAVDRVLNHPMNGGVVRTAPGGVPIALLYRQVEAMLMEPEQRLTRAAEFQHLVEDQRDRFLHTAVWVLLIAVADLHEANGRA